MKLKKFYFLIIIYSLPLLLNTMEAQSTYFVKTLRSERDNDHAWTIKTVNDGYIYGTGTYCYIEDVECTEVGKIDLDGKEIWRKKYVRVPQYGGGSITLSPSRIYLGGDDFYINKDSTYGSIRAFVLKMDQQGDSIWSKSYSENPLMDSIIRNESTDIKYHKGNLYFIGQVIDRSRIRSARLNIMKLDTNGNVLWKKILNTNNTPFRDSPKFTSEIFIDSTDHIYFFATVDSSKFYMDGIPYVGIFDTNGNVIMEQHLYPIMNQFDEIIPIQEPSYKLAGGLNRKTEELVWVASHGYSANTHDGIKFFAFNKEGKFLWRSKWQTYNVTNEYMHLHAFNNGDMVARYYVLEGGSPLVHEGTGLARINYKGDLLWKRRYFFKYDGIQAFFDGDLDETADNGIILSGGYLFKNQWKEFEDDVFFMKLDSMGCPFPNCTESDTLILLDKLLNHSENPKTDKSLYHWSLDNSTHQLKIQFDANITKPRLLANLLDLNGRMLSSTTLQAGEHGLVFDVESLPFGMYCVQFISGKVIKGFAFIK